MSLGMLSYLAQKPPDSGFLFFFHDGTPLSWDRLGQELRLALQAAGAEASGYSGHSFRIGAATQVDLSNSLILTLGRWKSAAFLDYIRTDQATLTSISARLANISS